MYCEECSEPTETRSVVRQQNRALRHVNRSLRRVVARLRHEADNLFMELCDVESEAERAMRELWESDEFTCGPQDYETLVKQSIEALEFFRNYKATMKKIEQIAPAELPEPLLCGLAPEGWQCTRKTEHSGPCAAIPR